MCTCECMWFCCAETVWLEWSKSKTMGESCSGISLCQNQTTIFFLWSARCNNGILAAGDHMATDSRLIRGHEDQTVSQIRLRLFTCIQHRFILSSFLQVFDNVCYHAQLSFILRQTTQCSYSCINCPLKGNFPPTVELGWLSPTAAALYFWEQSTSGSINLWDLVNSQVELSYHAALLQAR